MSGLNLKFSSTFFTASLPLTQSQIPNPKFPQFQQYSFRNRQTKRCGFIAAHADSSGLPLLPFDINQVLIPSESKTLHFYEARYLALLEEVGGVPWFGGLLLGALQLAWWLVVVKKSLFRKKKLFVHFVLDPVIVGDSSAGSSFAARYGCLVIIENVERLDVGALVSIRGIGRVKIMEFVQADPYLKGIVIPMQDNIFECESEISSKVSELKEALYSLNSLEIKLKAPKEELLQTCIAKSLMWAEKEPSVDCDEAFVPSLAERISFAALQPVTGSTQSELLELQREKLRAMDVRETLERIDDSLQLVRKSISMVVAKLAIQSLEVQ
ncbi:uncharacterized protein LOC100244294 isoform X2 [Vitis vinifera]|uniref:uncharacterized protein LOC100244294 isoform X2 n=1 Tax=Vitis vinifera TaxID=29760 RepID=UPI0005402214|nr:uncharacterized protein LOC100244294 isoform X2 [Vitis vinifera]XP_010665412.1 uncharacterized protein LOC100244294 isoform X2 [Vitis vinifera]|eukprot:XP_010665411.1 PREDICTED: uncharacterized protein LOC100244294 isoform X1 [Vitis vinifera]